MKEKNSSFRGAVAVATVLFTAAFAVRAADPSTGYDGAALPAGPDTSGTVVDVTAANAQYVLDGAYGSIDGKTINFKESVSEVLILGRPTKYPGSNTRYYTGDSGAFTTCYTDYATYVAAAAGQLAKYQRTVQNVTFTASDGVVLMGMQSADCGVDVCGPVYDYVRDASVAVGNAYNFAGKLTGIVFDGIDFARSDLESNVEFWGTYKYAGTDLQQVSGITFTNCSFTIGGTNGKHPAIEYHNQGTHGLLSDLIVDGCTFSNCNQGVYTHIVRNVTVRNSSFTTTGHNAIAVQTEDDVFSHGAVTITDNTFSGIGDRVMRFNMVGPDTQFTIRNNRVVDGGLPSEECMKATSLADGITYDIFGNDWSGFMVAYNPELRDPPAVAFTPASIDHATAAVYVDEAPVGKSGDAYVMQSNATAKVVYVAEEGRFFEHGVTAITNVLDTSVNPVTAAAPAAPAEPSVRIGRPAQRYPWNGVVDVPYRVKNWPAGGAGHRVKFTVKVGEAAPVDGGKIAPAAGGTVAGTYAIDFKELNLSTDCSGATVKAEIVAE